MDPAAETREELRSRRISTEDMARELLAEANRLRSDVTNPDRIIAWSETLEALADLLLPWAEQDGRFLQEWEERPCRVVRIRSASGNPDLDRFIPLPTASDCRAAQRIIMGLMSRAQLLVKTRKVSGPGVRSDQEAQKQAQEPRGQPASSAPEPLLGAL